MSISTSGLDSAAERELEVAAAARRIESDPDFADVRAISDEVDRLAADTAAKHLQ